MWNSHHQSIDLRHCVHKYCIKNWCVFPEGDMTCINAKANQERLTRTCLVERSVSYVIAAPDDDSDGDRNVLFKKIILFIYLWLCGLSLIAASRGYSPAAGFSLWGLLLLQLPRSISQVQQLWCMGFAAPQHGGSSRTGDGTCVSCIGRRTLYHWDPRGPQERPSGRGTEQGLGHLGPEVGCMSLTEGLCCPHT